MFVATELAKVEEEGDAKFCTMLLVFAITASYEDPGSAAATMTE